MKKSKFFSSIMTFSLIMSIGCNSNNANKPWSEREYSSGDIRIIFEEHSKVVFEDNHINKTLLGTYRLSDLQEKVQCKDINGNDSVIEKQEVFGHEISWKYYIGHDSLVEKNGYIQTVYRFMPDKDVNGNDSMYIKKYPVFKDTIIHTLTISLEKENLVFLNYNDSLYCKYGYISVDDDLMSQHNLSNKMFYLKK